MSRSNILISLAALCALGIAAVSLDRPVAAAPVGASADTPVASKPIHIAPHRALYKMKLASVRNGGNITGVSGQMAFEWRDVCDGWAIQQHMQLHFTYAEGGDQDITSTELTWESKDGKAYNYNIHHTTNGEETENYVGKAVLNEDGSGTATYTQPAARTETLAAGTIFPSAHTQLILREAMTGEKLFTRRVFDGSDEDGSDDISAFISPPKAVASEASLSDKLKSEPLLADAAWPVRMAFYKIGTDEPDYEMDLDLLPNGIARHMKIDYGDFAVTGTLENVEALPAPDCQ